MEEQSTYDFSLRRSGRRTVGSCSWCVVFLVDYGNGITGCNCNGRRNVNLLCMLPGHLSIFTPEIIVQSSFMFRSLFPVRWNREHRRNRLRPSPETRTSLLAGNEPHSAMRSPGRVDRAEFRRHWSNLSFHSELSVAFVAIA
jgi:hypothetical protein